MTTTEDLTARIRTSTSLTVRPVRDLGAVNAAKMLRELTGSTIRTAIPPQAATVELVSRVVVTPIKSDGTRNPNATETERETVLAEIAIEDVPGLIRSLSTALITGLEMPV